MGAVAEHADLSRPGRSTAVCLVLSVLLHGGGAVWISSAWAEGEKDRSMNGPDTAPETPDLPADDARLGIESSKQATINWLGFSEPTPHRATESEVEQAALSLAPVGAPEAPSNPSPDQERREEVVESVPAPATPASEPEAAAESPPISEEASTEQPSSPPPEQAVVVESERPVLAESDADVMEEPSKGEAETPEPETEAVEPQADEAPQETAEEQPEPDKAEQTETTEAEGEPEEQESKPETPQDSQPAQQKQEESTPAPEGAEAGADTLPGVIADRESTPTSKAVDLSIRDWGKPAAGEGIRVNPVRPRFPDTLAIFRGLLDATVLIDFGADGFVRDVRFEKVTVKNRTVVRNSGSPEADRVLLNSVYNWTANGEEIDALAEQGEDEIITIRMKMQIRP